MSAELPALSAVVARLADPKIHLAAYGGIVFPLALIVESPIIMLLAASTALSKDWASYVKIRRFMMYSGAALTALHLLIALTPLYYVVARSLLGAPQEIIEPGRIGLIIMTPWTWSIAYRRFHQGVLIRSGRSRAVSVGTVVRLGTNGVVLLIGYLLGNVPGIIVAASAVATGVVCEAAFVGIVVRPVLRAELQEAAPVVPALAWREFFSFYIPLVLTSLLTLLYNPIGSAALGRMPRSLESLAVWPVVSGLVFIFRSLGIAYNEVVVALLDEPGSSANLRRFATWLSVISTVTLLLVAVTPLSGLWFEQVTALDPDLAEIARTGFWLVLPLPVMSVLQSWYQGAILTGKRTRGITESVVIFLVASGVTLIAGVAWGRMTGLYIGLAGLTVATLMQTAWLWVRSRPVMAWVRERDVGPLAR